MQSIITLHDIKGIDLKNPDELRKIDRKVEVSVKGKNMRCLY